MVGTWEFESRFHTAQRGGARVGRVQQEAECSVEHVRRGSLSRVHARGEQEDGLGRRKRTRPHAALGLAGGEPRVGHPGQRRVGDVEHTGGAAYREQLDPELGVG